MAGALASEGSCRPRLSACPRCSNACDAPGGARPRTRAHATRPTPVRASLSIARGRMLDGIGRTDRSPRGLAALAAGPRGRRVRQPRAAAAGRHAGSRDRVADPGLADRRRRGARALGAPELGLRGRLGVRARLSDGLALLDRRGLPRRGRHVRLDGALRGAAAGPAGWRSSTASERSSRAWPGATGRGASRRWPSGLACRNGRAAMSRPAFPGTCRALRWPPTTRRRRLPASSACTG